MKNCVTVNLRTRVIATILAVVLCIAFTACGKIIMPNLNGLTLEKAQAIKGYDLLRVTVIEQSNNSYESGIIFKQSPAAGEELTKGTAVTLYVSSGSGADTPDTADNTDNADAESAIEKNPKILIPDVTGMDSDTAQATLNLMGFTVTTEIEENNEVTSGEVIRTKPATGAVVMQGAAVKIFLAMPSKTEKLVTVPDVSKQTLEAAKQNLSYLGLIVNRVTYTESSTTPHLVLSQD
ncbi:MAG: PASTA domain-containing protein, partial [Ruthenibacterium sp.]